MYDNYYVHTYFVRSSPLKNCPLPSKLSSSSSQLLSLPISGLWCGASCALVGAACLTGTPDAFVAVVSDGSVSVGHLMEGKPRMATGDLEKVTTEISAQQGKRL